MYIVKLVSRPGVLNGPADMGRTILGNVRLNPVAASVREMSESVSLYCYDGRWSWHDDFRGGMYIRGTVDGQACLVGVWPEQTRSTAELFARQGDFDIPLFDAFFTINNQKVAAQGTGYRNSEGYTRLYYMVRHRERDYCVFISTNSGAGSTPPESVHLNPAIFDLFRFNLVFAH
ncbi:MAG TPA: hypothetical protein VMX75_13310 [Spirochaetia bacterium]|nr:hypothetical protein [Spirochaetia bacterium]